MIFRNDRYRVIMARTRNFKFLRIFFLFFFLSGKLGGIYFPKDFKTLLVKLDDNILTNITSPSFDFRQIDYLNISKDIKESIKNPKDKILSYIIDDVSSLPE